MEAGRLASSVPHYPPLNIVMLVHPVEAIRAWQMAGAPMPLR